MKKILIIEDDQKIALGLCVRLKAHGYATWVAEDGVRGVGTALRVKPDLILLDISLPAGNGFALAEQLNKFPETQLTPVIFATASHDPALRQKALELGAAGILRKPYDAEELLVLVQQTLEAFDRSRLPFSDPQLDAAPAGANRAPRKILIVEDDEHVARALAIRMEAAGFQTTVASDALAAVRCAARSAPDVVLLDITLPAGDGFLVAERLQSNLPEPARIIFLTASARPDFRQRASQLGAVGFFEKPYEAEALMATIHQALD
jgi:DNA-binding response OmpR family regulator